MSVINTCGYNHASELALNVCDRLVALLLNKQIVWMRVLLELALLENKDSISVNDSGKSMSHDKDGAVLEAFAQSPLDQVISL